jgi:nondiscriminating aspartyl-tRNA synthetase
MTFVVIRDRTGLAQVVVPASHAGDVPPEETPVEVTGTATANTQAPGGIEVTEPEIRALSDDADTPPVELWRPTLNAGLPTLLDHAAVTWRHPVQRAKWELAAASMRGFRDTLDAEGFTEVASPKLVESATESGANVFEVDYFGRPAYLAQSPSSTSRCWWGSSSASTRSGRCSGPSRTTRCATWPSTSASTSSSASSRTTAR